MGCMEERLKEAADEVMRAVEAWKEAQVGCEYELRAAGQAVGKADARLRAAMRGIPLDRWRVLTAGGASLRDPGSARQAHLAARSRGTVEEALADVEQARARWAEARDRCRRETAEAARRLLGFDRLAHRVSGLSRGELQNLIEGVGDGRSPLGWDQTPNGGRRMATRTTVKDYQRLIARLDAGHGRAQAQLAAARQRRAEVLAEQDRLVREAEAAVDEAVADMAVEVGADLAASLLERDVSEVRRLAKRRRQV